MQAHIGRACSLVLGVLTVLVAAAGPLYAGGVVPTAAPEIDATSILAGVGLLGAGIMVLRARRRSK